MAGLFWIALALAVAGQAPKLRRELRPGARIVSHQFPIGRWPPDRTIRAGDGTDLFLWTVPPR